MGGVGGMRKKIAVAWQGYLLSAWLFSCLTCHGSQGAEPEGRT